MCTHHGRFSSCHTISRICIIPYMFFQWDCVKYPPQRWKILGSLIVKHFVYHHGYDREMVMKKMDPNPSVSQSGQRGSILDVSICLSWPTWIRNMALCVGVVHVSRVVDPESQGCCPRVAAHHPAGWNCCGLVSSCRVLRLFPGKPWTSSSIFYTTLHHPPSVL